MKKIEVLPVFLLLISLLMLTFFDCLSKEISLHEALKKGLIKLNLQSLGGHSENCVQVKVYNASSNPLQINLEPGVVLDNLDESQQDIIVVKNLKMNLRPNQNLDTVAYGFCCQSQNSGPQKGQKFILGKKSDSIMVKLCNYLNTHKIEPWKAQSAIWTLSNKHKLSSIGESKDTSIAALFKICNEGRNEVLPWFYVVYSKVPGVVFSNKACKIVLNFEYTKKTDKQLVIAVYDKSGHKIKTLLANSYGDAGLKSYHFDFDVVNWNEGTYTVKITEWQQEPMMKTFEI